jgi:hypothetical protein
MFHDSIIAKDDKKSSEIFCDRLKFFLAGMLQVEIMPLLKTFMVTTSFSF